MFCMLLFLMLLDFSEHLKLVISKVIIMISGKSSMSVADFVVGIFFLLELFATI